MSALFILLTILFLVVIPLVLSAAIVAVMFRLEYLALRAKDGEE